MQFKDTYYDSITAASKILDSGCKVAKDANLPSQIRLPFIELAKFGLLYEQWFPLYDVFASIAIAYRRYENSTTSSHLLKKQSLEMYSSTFVDSP